MIALFKRLMTDQKGQDLIEYALLGGFLSLAAITGATALGTSLNDWYDAVATQVDSIAPGGG